MKHCSCKQTVQQRGVIRLYSVKTKLNGKSRTNPKAKKKRALLLFQLTSFPYTVYGARGVKARFPCTRTKPKKRLSCRNMATLLIHPFFSSANPGGVYCAG
uniref:Uncharacterized protein n=1 Tax=Cacopsylla melanoneura TaxID=428564 RepID=A0A8D8W686_9HEMI